MPGMMDTVLNIGMNDEVVQGMIKIFDDHHFVQADAAGHAVDRYPAEDAIIVAIGQETEELYGSMPVSARDFFSPERSLAESRLRCIESQPFSLPSPLPRPLHPPPTAHHHTLHTITSRSR